MIEGDRIMALTGRNKLVAAGAAAIVLVPIIGWFVLSSVANSRAESVISEFVDKHDLRSEVSWGRVSASPTGSVVRIDDLRVDPGGDEERLHVARVEIRELVDEDRHKRAAVRMSGITVESGGSPVGQTEFAWASGRAELPPASLEARWELRLDEDDVVLRAEFDQPGLLKVAFELELERVAGLVEFADSSLRNGALGDLSIESAFAMIEMLGDVRVRRIALVFDDDGYVPRSVALLKRYSIPVDPASATTAEAQREQEFRKVVGEARTECLQELPFPSRTERERACTALIGFATGEHRRINLRVVPERPVSVGELFENAMQNPERLVRLLRPEIGT